MGKNEMWKGEVLLDSDSIKQYQSLYPSDPEYELYLNAWKIYFQTADRIDGHIKLPRDSEERKTIARALSEAQKAQDEFLKTNHYSPDQVDREKWIQAKSEALRRFKGP